MHRSEQASNPAQYTQTKSHPKPTSVQPSEAAKKRNGDSGNNGVDGGNNGSDNGGDDGNSADDD
ncbi:hypothetical protein LTR28_009706 [Elasticomyces elasticus]|nr:hypothetical protein LTR28_009706 [Elasticomyces elasticus]